jgi:hypothetical protein
MLKALSRDERGSAAIVPAYVIVSVITLSTVVTALFTATTAASRAEAQSEMAAASRTAVTAFEAELNTKPLAAITAELAAEGADYQPNAGITSDAEQIRYLKVEPASGTVRLTFEVEPSNNFTDPRSYTVEFTSQPVAQVEGEWVPTAGAPQSKWIAKRTLPTGGAG